MSKSLAALGPLLFRLSAEIINELLALHRPWREAFLLRDLNVSALDVQIPKRHGEEEQDCEDDRADVNEHEHVSLPIGLSAESESQRSTAGRSHRDKLIPAVYAILSHFTPPAKAAGINLISSDFASEDLNTFR